MRTARRCKRMPLSPRRACQPLRLAQARGMTLTWSLGGSRAAATVAQ